MSSQPLPGRARGSLLAALSIQSRVVGAMILRELHTRYGRDNVGYLWMVFEPMMLATVIGSLHLASSHGQAEGGNMQPAAFGVLGYTTFILFRGIVNRAAGALEANAPLLYHRQVTVLDLSIARALLEFAGVFTTFIVLWTLMVTVGLAQLPVRPLYLIAAWFLMFWYSLAQAVLITAITYENRTAERLVHPYSYFMVGLSGSFFQVAWIPHPFREWLTYIPLTSIFELARYGMFSGTNLDYFFGLYLIGACVALTWIGLICNQRVQSHIHLT